MSDPRWRQMLSYLLPGTRQLTEQCPVALHRRRIFILPTGYGVVFGILMFVMLVGSLNYNNALGLLMTFLLTMIAMVSSIYCYRNLLDIEITSAWIDDTFAGDRANLSLVLTNQANRDRFDLIITVVGEETPAVLIKNSKRQINLKLPTSKRGILRAPRISIQTCYPIGLFKAWVWLRLEKTAAVYPAPEIDAPDWRLSATALDQRDSLACASGDEDFDHIREYRLGDSPGKIAWKVAARRDQWVSKAMNAPVHEDIWLHWRDTGGLDFESRLSRLSAWIERAQNRGLRYGLELPTLRILPGIGRAHRRKCQRALALFDQAPHSQGVWS